MSERAVSLSTLAVALTMCGLTGAAPALAIQWNDIHRIAAKEGGDEGRVVIDNRGDTTALWEKRNPAYQHDHHKPLMLLRAASRRSGAGWQRPVTLGTDPYDLALAVDRHGVATAAWLDLTRGDLLVATRPRAKSWSQPVRIARHVREGVAVAQNSTGLVALAAVTCRSRDCRLNVLTRAGRRWRSHTIVKGSPLADIATNSAGDLAVTWSRDGSYLTRGKIKVRTAHGKWSRVFDLGFLTTLRSVVVSNQGVATVVGYSEDSVVHSRQVDVRLGQLGPDEIVGRASSNATNPPALTVAPSGSVTAGWLGDVQGVESATRTPAGEWSQAAPVAVDDDWFHPHFFSWGSHSLFVLSQGRAIKDGAIYEGTISITLEDDGTWGQPSEIPLGFAPIPLDASADAHGAVSVLFEDSNGISTADGSLP